MTITTLLRRAAFVLAVSAPILAMPATAQAQNPQEMLEQADANRDGSVAWEEVVALRVSSFARLDRNGDGFIDSADRPPSRFGRRFDEAFTGLAAQYDANADQRISQSELIDAPAPLFEKGDTDGDNVLSQQEMQALRDAAAAGDRSSWR